ncbi:enoyl-CoA hydratase/isomerase family protein [Bradyrhizobium canariense]|uniref:Enoyl-CoA hydratase/carnithine racemase n=1 Tax=Bradyrhizobium canariense TaxID=255045 RepID=A0A1H1NHU2_9BRAD|nr:enoyl-CoA hydratase-related protein [Bradyrhizobium canariense]SDR98483.1 Enoyl-CoA hydratase/carnithine racemase [Bradyrhizobium canariense]
MTGPDFRIEGRIAKIVLDRPESQNLLSQHLLSSLRTIANDLAANPDIQVLTITGEGNECFSTGILTPALRGELAKDQVLQLIRLANETFDAIEALPQIVIAGLNGYVRAGAVELILACDIRIAGDHVRLSSPEAKWGGFPGAGAPVRLPDIIGVGRTLELLCTGREIDAIEMERIGLVERVVPKDGVHAEIDRLAHAIAANGPLATRGTKRIVRSRKESGFRAARELSDALRAALEWTHDVDEGIAAVREGRKPRFTGK